MYNKKIIDNDNEPRDSIEKNFRTMNKEFKDFGYKLLEQFDLYLKCKYPECTLIETRNEFELFLICDYCQEDLYRGGIEDDDVKKFKYCPYCGAKIVGRRYGVGYEHERD